MGLLAINMARLLCIIWVQSRGISVICPWSLVTTIVPGRLTLSFSLVVGLRGRRFGYRLLLRLVAWAWILRVWRCLGRLWVLVEVLQGLQALIVHR